jgi:putative transposase
VHHLAVHLVFVVKYRRKVISNRVRELLSASFQDTGLRLGCQIQAVDGEADHIHLLVRYPPSLSVSRLVLALKSNSARKVREARLPVVQRKLWGAHFWSPSYFASSTGGANLETVKAYIEAQREGAP